MIPNVFGKILKQEQDYCSFKNLERRLQDAFSLPNSEELCMIKLTVLGNRTYGFSEMQLPWSCPWGCLSLEVAEGGFISFDLPLLGIIDNLLLHHNVLILCDLFFDYVFMYHWNVWASYNPHSVQYLINCDKNKLWLWQSTKIYFLILQFPFISIDCFHHVHSILKRPKHLC